MFYCKCLTSLTFGFNINCICILPICVWSSSGTFSLSPEQAAISIAVSSKMPVFANLFIIIFAFCHSS